MMMLPWAFMVRLAAPPAVLAIAEEMVMSPLPWPSPDVPLVVRITLVPAFKAELMVVLRTMVPPEFDV